MEVNSQIRLATLTPVLFCAHTSFKILVVSTFLLLGYVLKGLWRFGKAREGLARLENLRRLAEAREVQGDLEEKFREVSEGS